MKEMPSRDTSGKCQGECRDRVFEGEDNRQKTINQERSVSYSAPSENSPSWTSNRDDPPGSMGGRV